MDISWLAVMSAAACFAVMQVADTVFLKIGALKAIKAEITTKASKP